MTSEKDFGKLIYVVDDEEIVRNSTALLVESIGFESKCFSDAFEFLAFIKEAESPGSGILMLDYRMPGMNGMELIEKLNALEIVIPTILITGYIINEIRESISQSNLVAVLKKPYELGELQSYLDRFATDSN